MHHLTAPCPELCHANELHRQGHDLSGVHGGWREQVLVRAGVRGKFKCTCACGLVATHGGADVQGPYPTLTPAPALGIPFFYKQTHQIKTQI